MPALHNYSLHCTTIARTAQPPTFYTMPSDISPFFEAGSPPPPFPIPTCQTNLADFISPVVHLAHTVLTPRTKARHNGIVHVFSPPNPGRSSHAGRALPAVIGQGQFIPKTIERTPTATSAEGTDSDLTSLSESSSNRSTPTPAPASAPGRLVCKPKGEVGHPGRGGYTLKKAVDFDSGTLRKIQVCRTLPLPSHI